jgi:hypothetical protein
VSTRIHKEQAVYLIVRSKILQGQHRVTEEEIVDFFMGLIHQTASGKFQEEITERTVRECLNSLDAVQALNKQPFGNSYVYEYNDQAACPYFSGRKLSPTTFDNYLKQFISDGWLLRAGFGLYRVNVRKLYELEGFLPALEGLLAKLNRIYRKNITLRQLTRLMFRRMTRKQVKKWFEDSQNFLLA